MINWTQQKYLRSVCHNNCEHESWIWGRMSMDIISRRICYSSRSAIFVKEGFLRAGRGKKEVFGVEKSDFLESLWWTESRIAKKSSPQKISGRGTVLEFSEQNDGWGGRCAPREWGGDRRNAGVAWVCVWERVSVCASVKKSVCLGLRVWKDGERKRERAMLGIFLKSLPLSSPQFQHGRWRHWKNLVFLVCTVVPLPSRWFSSSVSSCPLTLSFSLSCSVKLFSVVPSSPEAVSSLLAQFLKLLSPPTFSLGFSSVLVL